MELPHIGEHCVICNRNDYLPFKCSYCGKIVCVDHRTNHGLECHLNQSNKSEHRQDGPPVESLKGSCDHCKKITLKLELSKCQSCEAIHCLYHRHQVQHNCPKLAESKEAKRQEDEEKSIRQKVALNRLKESQRTSRGVGQSTYIAPPLPTDPKKRALAKRIRVMKIKQSARGPPNIPEQDKIYFEVKFQHEPKSGISDQSLDGKFVRLFTTGKHTIGRMIDWSADELKVTNKNKISDADQLVFKKLIDGTNELITLDSQASFQSYLDSSQLENGDEILLTYQTKH